MKKSFATLREAYNLAKKNISRKKWNWMSCGSEKEYTLNANLDYFKKFKINQKILAGVGNVKLEKQFLGKKIKFPMIIAPMGYMTQYHKNGELDLALGAYNAGTFMCLSAVSSIKIDEITKKNKKLNLIYQFYSLRPKKWVKAELRKITNLGVKAICVTGDSPVRSIKYDIIEDKHDARKHGKIGLPRAPLQHMSKINWEDIRWLKKQTKLPIIIKGIMNIEDAKKSFKNGASIIWVSNHGGRTLDSGISSLETLIKIRKKFKNKQIIFDGGVRTGTDMFKAICLGADIVSIGRPSIWGLILGGSKGVSKILNLFFDEFKSVMGLSGCKNLKSANTKFIIK